MGNTPKSGTLSIYGIPNWNNKWAMLVDTMVTSIATIDIFRLSAQQLSPPSICHMRALSLTANYAGARNAVQSSICNSLSQSLIRNVWSCSIANPAIDSPVAISGHTHLPGNRRPLGTRPGLSIRHLSIKTMDMDRVDKVGMVDMDMVAWFINALNQESDGCCAVVVLGVVLGGEGSLVNSN